MSSHLVTVIPVLSPTSRNASSEHKILKSTVRPDYDDTDKDDNNNDENGNNGNNNDDINNDDNGKDDANNRECHLLSSSPSPLVPTLVE